MHAFADSDAQLLLKNLQLYLSIQCFDNFGLAFNKFYSNNFQRFTGDLLKSFESIVWLLYLCWEFL